MKRSHWRGLSLNLYGDFMALIGGNLRKSFSDGDNLWQIGLIYSMAFKMCWTESWAFRCSRGPQKLFHWACLIDNIIECVLIITIESTRLRNAKNPALHLIRYIVHIIWSIRYIYGSYQAFTDELSSIWQSVHQWTTTVHILIFLMVRCPNPSMRWRVHPFGRSLPSTCHYHNLSSESVHSSISKW